MLRRVKLLVVLVLFVSVSRALSKVIIETVPIGNAGNVGELSGDGNNTRICGAVDYEYNIGKYEITYGQYVEFLNAVAADDTYDLYNADMWRGIYGGIERIGSPGNYTYSVTTDWVNRPVIYVSWGDAARFANWLHNGQPTGAQTVSTTEAGSYYLNGATTDAALMTIVREPDATWVIPTEDEWYKAAYHKNDGVTGNYYDYPTGSDSIPSNDLVEPIDPGNNATYFDGQYPDPSPSGYTIGTPFWRTEVGAHENSESPYGTFDQGGNVEEWNEASNIGTLSRGVRGGTYFHWYGSLRSQNRNSSSPSTENYLKGFRIVIVLFDCNNNGTDDHQDIQEGTSNDCNFNYIPDECEPDCNNNDIPIDCIVCETSADCDDCNEYTRDACFKPDGQCIHLRTISATPGDMDGDGDSDLRDYAIFSACFTGPSGETPTSCPFQPVSVP